MDNKEAIAVLKSNYPHGRIMISEAVDLSIKTLEAAESQTTAVQQLKAEIAAFIPRVLDFNLEDDFDNQDRDELVAKMRQLSAVQ